MKKCILGLSAIALVSGCVSKGKYTTEINQRDEALVQEKAAVTALTGEKQALTSEKQQLEQKLIVVTKDRGQLKTSLDEMKQAMAEMRARQAEERKRLKEFEDLTARFKKLTDAGTLSVKIIEGKMVVSLGSDVLFGSGSAKLSAAGLESIKEVTAQLKAIPGKVYQVEGHTDNLPIATAAFPSNWELASARALNVTRAMVDAGMLPARVSAASFGDTQPIQANDTAEGKAANRRIAIVVVPDLSTMPGYDELNKLSSK
ncbi:OmpA family protein [Bdellovibrio sp. HCB209]|uniref:OmpA/MotB family protein n=1 Tax=Bdellovibrio sp. HCB209 TaxID=3394354 RepID=UPI0039B5C95D